MFSKKWGIPSLGWDSSLPSKEVKSYRRRAAHCAYVGDLGVVRCLQEGAELQLTSPCQALSRGVSSGEGVPRVEKL
jgi:hypothetical protein